MSDLPPALEELLVDRDGQAALREIETLISSLEKQGIPPAAISRAMSRALISLCERGYNAWGKTRFWARKFLELTGKKFTAKYDQINAEEMLLVEEKKRLEKMDAELNMRILTELEPYGSA